MTAVATVPLRVFVAKVRSLAGRAEDVPPPPPVEGVGVSRALVGALTETACGVAVRDPRRPTDAPRK